MNELNVLPISNDMSAKYIYLKWLLGYQTNYKEDIHKLAESAKQEIMKQFIYQDSTADFRVIDKLISEYLMLFYHSGLYAEGVKACEELEKYCNDQLSEIPYDYQEYYQMLSEHITYTKMFFHYLIDETLPTLSANAEYTDNYFKCDLPSFYAKVKNFFIDVQQNKAMTKESWEWNYLVLTMYPFNKRLFKITN